MVDYFHPVSYNEKYKGYHNKLHRNHLYSPLNSLVFYEEKIAKLLTRAMTFRPQNFNAIYFKRLKFSTRCHR